jgi:hypothetical protein
MEYASWGIRRIAAGRRTLSFSQGHFSSHFSKPGIWAAFNAFLKRLMTGPSRLAFAMVDRLAMQKPELINDCVDILDD